MTFDPREFRFALGRFATGVTVVGHSGPEGPRGVTVNAFTSVSLDPPLVLVSLARSARSHDLLAGKPFSVNVLAVEQEALARHFAGQAQDVTITWIDDGAAPRLPGCVAWFECSPWAAYDGGDHTLYVGKVESFGTADADALGFFMGRFSAIARPIPSQPAVPYDPFELPYDA